MKQATKADLVLLTVTLLSALVLLPFAYRQLFVLNLGPETL